MNDTTEPVGATRAGRAAATRAASKDHWMMWASCLAMLAGTGFVVYAAPPGLGLGRTLLLGLPLLGCLAMHMALPRLTGRSCHGGSHAKDETR